MHHLNYRCLSGLQRRSCTSTCLYDTSFDHSKGLQEHLTSLSCMFQVSMWRATCEVHPQSRYPKLYVHVIRMLDFLAKARRDFPTTKAFSLLFSLIRPRILFNDTEGPKIEANQVRTCQASSSYPDSACMRMITDTTG